MTVSVMRRLLLTISRSVSFSHTHMQKERGCYNVRNEGLERRETVGQEGKLLHCKCRESGETLPDCVWSGFDMDRNTNSRPHDLYLRVNPM